MDYKKCSSAVKDENDNNGSMDFELMSKQLQMDSVCGGKPMNDNFWNESVTSFEENEKICEKSDFNVNSDFSWDAIQKMETKNGNVKNLNEEKGHDVTKLDDIEPPLILWSELLDIDDLPKAAHLFEKDFANFETDISYRTVSTPIRGGCSSNNCSFITANEDSFDKNLTFVEKQLNALTIKSLDNLSNIDKEENIEIFNSTSYELPDASSCIHLCETCGEKSLNFDDFLTNKENIKPPQNGRVSNALKMHNSTYVKEKSYNLPDKKQIKFNLENTFDIWNMSDNFMSVDNVSLSVSEIIKGDSINFNDTFEEVDYILRKGQDLMAAKKKKSAAHHNVDNCIKYNFTAGETKRNTIKGKRNIKENIEFQKETINDASDFYETCSDQNISGSYDFNDTLEDVEYIMKKGEEYLAAQSKGVKIKEMQSILIDTENEKIKEELANHKRKLR